MPRKPKPIQSKSEAGVDVFSRMPKDTVEKLDAIAEDQRRSRSLMVLMAVEDLIARDYPKVLERRKANG